jgi:hypothetical protein
MLRIPILLAVALATGCGGPISMVPGGELSGPVQATPADWAFSNDHETVQLETRPTDPYSVNVWGVAIGDHFYVAGSKDSTWVAHVTAEPAVRLRIDGAIYELAATPTEDEGEIDAFLAAVEKKYDWESDEEQRENAVLFRLDPRS